MRAAVNSGAIKGWRRCPHDWIYCTGRCADPPSDDEESAELIRLRTDAIDAMRQEARGKRGVMQRRQAPTAEWPSACRNFSRYGRNFAQAAARAVSAKAPGLLSAEQKVASARLDTSVTLCKALKLLRIGRLLVGDDR